jgi:hypothetical protein
MAEGQESIVVHYLSGLNDELRHAAEELRAILRSLMMPKTEKKEPIPPWEKHAHLQRIAEQMVLLKGNDILVYADTHFKYIPERDTPAPANDLRLAEFQLLLAFRRREEYGDNASVEIVVDNGQPHLRREGLIPRTI